MGDVLSALTTLSHFLACARRAPTPDRYPPSSSRRRPSNGVSLDNSPIAKSAALLLASSAQKAALKNLSPERIAAKELAGEAIEAKLAKAPGNDQPIGGIKVVAKSGWFAAFGRYLDPPRPDQVVHQTFCGT